ncbi:MAG: acyl dehydratase [Desulfobacter sp.]|nr:acyl dehydratase [Desulfobacter sp.]WDP84357.1 MAG: acyl dehydratase [Desulfobacter sp.]
MPSFLRKKAVHGLTAGDVFVITRTFTWEETEKFGDLTRDYNPVHYDKKWARAKKFDTLICHGLLVGGMVCEFGGQVGWLATGMDFKFLKLVYPGDTIECRITITQMEENGRACAEGSFFNQKEVLVARVFLKGRLPAGRDKDLLNQMIDQGDPTNKLA